MVASCLPAPPRAVGNSNKSGLFQKGFAGSPKWFHLPDVSDAGVVSDGCAGKGWRAGFSGQSVAVNP
jgi:hypothetical protein